MDGSVQSFVVSGYGDGALIDLCRLTIERFRQDRILYDLFGPDLAAIEDKLRAAASTVPASSSIFSMLESLEKPDLESALKALRTRIRKDTKVTLQMGGNAQRSGQLNSSLPDVFFRTSSFTNRLLLYLLYRCGAFVPRFDTIEEVVRDHQGPLDNVICRYGPNTMRHVLKSFVDGPEIEQRLAEIKEAQAQQVRFEWRPGVFPTYSG
jgi:hypothetical protein